MEQYCIYLRKSRADAEAEARGEGETLARHERALIELAKRKEINVVHIYREIVSGDSIAARPQMQQMLQDIMNNIYDGVLVMEVERLARGDTIDQGIVAQAFRESGTLIVTPVKTYDPNNEYDEEYFEFSLFMSRREYKTIKRRMQAGRVASVKEGNYIGTNPPYGYRKISPEPKVHTLEIIPEEAAAVKMIFDMYLSGKGPRAIAAELNRLQIQPQKSLCWESVTIRKMLRNPIYAGKIRWNAAKNDAIIVDGYHDAIVSEEIFQKVQDKMETNPSANLKPETSLKNYYHNLLYCKNCGHQMKRRPTPSGKEYLLCRYNQCRGKVVASSTEAVDEVVLSAVRYRLNEIYCSLTATTDNKMQNDNAEAERYNMITKALERLKKQKNRLHTLLETEVYDTETYLERSKIISEQQNELEKQLKDMEIAKPQPKLTPDESIMWLKYVLDNFDAADENERNDMLKRIIKRIDYQKTMRMCNHKRDSDLNLDVVFL